MLRRYLSNEMPDIRVDVNQMRQVFVNLLLNSVEAIQEKGPSLAFGYRIVRNHHGDTRVFSRPGQGTRFILLC